MSPLPPSGNPEDWFWTILFRIFNNGDTRLLYTLKHMLDGVTIDFDYLNYMSDGIIDMIIQNLPVNSTVSRYILQIVGDRLKSAEYLGSPGGSEADFTVTTLNEAASITGSATNSYDSVTKLIVKHPDPKRSCHLRLTFADAVTRNVSILLLPDLGNTNVLSSDETDGQDSLIGLGIY